MKPLAIERLATLAGYPTPQWPGGRPRRQSARERRRLYATRTPAARFELAPQPTTGQPTRLCNFRTLDIARPSQTRGTSRIPDAQDIAHALGAVAAGNPERDANPIGVAMAYDWITGTPGHPWLPERAVGLVIADIATGRRALRLAPRERVAARFAAYDATAVAYTGLVTGLVLSAEPPDQVRDLPESAWTALCEASLRILTSYAEQAAGDALRML